MKTLLAMVSIGLARRNSVKAGIMAMAFARRHGYDFTVIHSDIVPKGRSVHYAKMRVLALFGNYDRYCIVDDDLLLSRHAPALPDLPEGSLVGMVPDPSQDGLPSGHMTWVGNTGFILCLRAAAPFFEAAIAMGDQPGLPGHADQPPFNRANWDTMPPTRLDWRWNYLAVVDYFLRNGGFEKWQSDRSRRIRFYAQLAVGIGSSGTVKRVKSAYGLHLTCCAQPWPVLKHFE